MTEPKDPAKIDTPTAQTVGRETLGYVLREINEEQKRHARMLESVAENVEDVLTNQRQYARAVQEMGVELERVVKKVGEHNRKIKRLEAARPYRESADPILPPPDVEDSWNSRLPPDFIATLSDLTRREGERKKRESFFWKANWKLAYALAAALIVGGAGAAIGWVVAHSGAPASEVRR